MSRKPQLQVPIQEWASAGFKGLVVGFVGLLTFFAQQLNSSITALNVTIRAIEVHQIETDKRVAAIEVSREINLASYQKLIADVTDMKQSMIQNTMRLQTISDFVAKHYK